MALSRATRRYACSAIPRHVRCTCSRVVGRVTTQDHAVGSTCPHSIKLVLPCPGHVNDVAYQALSSLSACNIERSGEGLGTRLVHMERYPYQNSATLKSKEIG